MNATVSAFSVQAAIPHSRVCTRQSVSKLPTTQLPRQLSSPPVRQLSKSVSTSRVATRHFASVTRAACNGVEGLSVQVLPTDADVELALCEAVLKSATEAIASKGAFSLAVPGGRIPKMLAHLTSMPAAKQVDWSKCHLFFVNERQNEGKCCSLNKAQFADALGIPDDNIHAPITGESPDSASAYDQTLRSQAAQIIPSIDGMPSLDMALIGLGNDGHIGSVYPGSETAKVHSAASLALPVDKPGKQSITMSLAMMAAAQITIVASCGSAKVDAVSSAIRLSSDSASWSPGAGAMPWVDSPSARLASGQGETLWILDTEAAAGL
mmetsp:Transcript_20519/g.28430  ORF Transcript_20519/g.28430 Transcript_20519/m.28430 type:complete len:324 (-) Transcript_20519:74-1045(-)|eukprot:CAMPEP_0196580138 /NCGR_PEP_ID=MMETSP1081-20130531/27355_1 /TAXON_ID=36882 /ORGANISM="Pyramimonas amylifera, Strain CCMP720" /LENGTH=323 /DNA_ID=CAMNT_0041899933 /DNA_START=81 /DNA_END=1052 /DNA_ORIENTATION=-